MRHIRVLGLCLVAAFALSVAATSVASASEPALYECVPAGKITIKYKKGKHEYTREVYTGEYKESLCKKAAKDKYRKYTSEPGPEGMYMKQELNIAYKGHASKFVSVGSPPGTLEVPHVSTIVCAHTYDEGEFTGPKTAGNIIAKFTGCKASNQPCQNGATTGEITTNLLKGEVGYISKSAKTVGVDIKAQSGEVLAEFQCGLPPAAILRLRTTGSLIGKATPVDAWSETATINFEQVGGKQDIKELEGFTEPDFLITYNCKEKEPCEPENPTESGESAKGEGKGERLYLKA